MRSLWSAGVAAILLVASCLNPQPDDFPQATRAPSPSIESSPSGPADIRPGSASDDSPSSQTPVEGFGNAASPSAPLPNDAPAGGSPDDGADDDADAGAPPSDAGLPDATPVVAPR